MLQLFRNYNPFTILLLIIAAFLMKWQALLHPVAPEALPNHLLFRVILDVLQPVFRNAFGFTLLTVLMLIGQALFLNNITVRYKLFLRNTYLPAFTFLLMTSVHPSLSYFSEPLLMNWFVLIALKLMMTFSQTAQPRKQIFNAGFAICLPALFQFPAVGFFALLILSLIFLRSFDMSEWIVGLVGYLTPVYFFACILFLFDKLGFFRNMVEIGFSFPLQGKQNTYLIVLLSGLSVLVISGSVGLQRQLNFMTIFIRRSWGLIYTYLVVAVGVALISVSFVNAQWLLTLPALSLLIVQSFSFHKSKRFSNFAFYFAVVLVIFCQTLLNT